MSQSPFDQIHEAIRADAERLQRKLTDGSVGYGVTSIEALCWSYYKRGLDDQAAEENCPSCAGTGRKVKQCPNS